MSELSRVDLRDQRSWELERCWTIHREGQRSEVQSTLALASRRICALLGSAGMGKTFELARLAEIDRQNGMHVKSFRMVELAQDPEGLTRQLQTLTFQADHATAIHLDALDEIAIPVKAAMLVVERWVREHLSPSQASLRISCRSAVWAGALGKTFEELFGWEGSAVAILQPISTGDVRKVAAQAGICADQFEQAIVTSRTMVFAQQPLTLKMLLRVYSQNGQLPANRRDLFEQGVSFLAMERRERQQVGSQGDFTFTQLLDGAERLACLTLLSAREVIDLSDEPANNSLSRWDLNMLPQGGEFSDDLLTALARSGLFDSDRPDQFRFAHRQLAEYLTGRRLGRLPPHQSKSLLATGLGPEFGVSGPLQETAAFAAMHNEHLAAWIADHDPVVFGYSDVANDMLRRRAAMSLLGKFRRQEITDTSLLGPGAIPLTGFQYPNAETDLRPILQERQSGSADVLECAIGFVESWRLEGLIDDLASLMLDSSAPLESRRAAGYAIRRMGAAQTQERLLPLIQNTADDPLLDLKGLALHCCWPDHLSGRELLEGITEPLVSGYGGAYSGFLVDLDLAGFCAEGCLYDGLAWANSFIGDSDSDIHPQGRLARRIAIRAVRDVEDPQVALALAQLMLLSKTRSIFEIGDRYCDGQVESAASLFESDSNVRRRLLLAVTAHALDQAELWWPCHQATGLMRVEDFPWLLENAADERLPLQQRTNLAEIAFWLPWQLDPACVDAWLRCRKTEPVTSRFAAYPTYMSLNEKEAAQTREREIEERDRQLKEKREQQAPAAAPQIEEALSACETDDPRCFFWLSEQLSVKPTSRYREFCRFLTRSPGWENADDETRKRIIEAAKTVLLTETDDPEACRDWPLDSSCLGYLVPLWLILECEPDWIDSSLDPDWWCRWCWYILREVRANFGEPNDQKTLLLEKLNEKAPREITAELCRLAASNMEPDQKLLTQLLPLLQPLKNEELDEHLRGALLVRGIQPSVAGEAASFLLRRSFAASRETCRTLLQSPPELNSDEMCVVVAVALMQTLSPSCWEIVRSFLHKAPASMNKEVLARFANSYAFRSWQADTPIADSYGVEEIGEIAALMMSTFPPECDPPRDRASTRVGTAESVKRLRDDLIRWLGDQAEIEAVNALRELDRRFGHASPWLRRPRARAESNYYRSYWKPIPPITVAEILLAEQKRLIRSEADAVEGVLEALRQYERRLHHSSPHEIEDLWNRPHGAAPSPKEEERVSDKICAAIRDYFERYAMTADREVQVFRRTISRQQNGTPGSEVDVLCRIPPVGISNNSASPIILPIEVKLSHNSEVPTGLRRQLVDRYMRQLGASRGIYVVAWMDRPTADSSLRPRWGTRQEAIEDLEQQASDVEAGEGGIIVAVCVIDASLNSSNRV